MFTALKIALKVFRIILAGHDAGLYDVRGIHMYSPEKIDKHFASRLPK